MNLIQNKLLKFKFQLALQIMVIPGIIWLGIFCYVPMLNIIIAFKDYKVSGPMFNGNWVAFKHFEAFFSDPFAIQSISNTLIISFLKLIICFPAPILFALLLNEMRSMHFKRIAQTISYLPFFISWVVLSSLITTLLGMEGPVNYALIQLGLQSQKINYLGDPKYFRAIAVLSDMWKTIGWSSILYIAAITSIPQDMYEAAYIDGASRFQRVWHITVPCIRPTIVILLILAVSGILGSNFEQHFLLGKPQTYDVADTIDTYVYRMGLQLGRYSYATAINLFRAIIAFILLFAADRSARIISRGEQGLF